MPKRRLTIVRPSPNEPPGAPTTPRSLAEIADLLEVNVLVLREWNEREASFSRPVGNDEHGDLGNLDAVVTWYNAWWDVGRRRDGAPPACSEPPALTAAVEELAPAPQANVALPAEGRR